MDKFKIKQILTEVLYDSRLCESANQQSMVDFFYDKLLLEKLLVGEPVGVPELRKILRNKILNFEFIKLDGEVRKAKGTTMMKYIPTPDHPKGIRPSSKKVATFFDLEKKAWRSVSQRSKEIVLKYAFSEKGEPKKPVFIVRDKEDPDEDPDDDNVSKTEEPDFSEPTSTGDKDTDFDYVSPDAEGSDDEFDFDIDPSDEFDNEEEFDFEDDDFDWDDDEDEEEEDPFYDNSNDPDIEKIRAVSKPKLKPISKPQVDPVEVEQKHARYGWKIKDAHKIDTKPKVEPIVRSSITNVKPVETPEAMRDETVLLPRQINTEHPFVQPSFPTKEPPLEIESEEDEF